MDRLRDYFITHLISSSSRICGKTRGKRFAVPNFSQNGISYFVLSFSRDSQGFNKLVKAEGIFAIQKITGKMSIKGRLTRSSFDPITINTFCLYDGKCWY